MRKLKFVLLIVLGVALYCAATVGTASGARLPGAYKFGANAWDCDPQNPTDPSLHATGRGTFLREPDLGQVATDLPASAKGKAGKNFSATIPVYFHVVTDGSIGSLTAKQISAQMTVLNRTFAGAEGGAETGFSFRLAGVTRTDNANWFYAGPGGTDEHSMKAALHQGGTNALNFYSTTAGPGLLGYAYLPDIVTKPGQAYLDGIVINWESIPGTSTAFAGRYDEGKTATHEAGHWLDLEHTFYGGCNAKGDFVSDTPAEKTPTSGCPANKDTCAEPGLDPIHNYMDYSYDGCYSEFTQGQTQRMRDAWLFYRA
jgi:Pregnancy-associated plasma protein-A